MQSDYEVSREAGASPDPSWHSDSDESDATNTTASTPRENAQYGFESGRSTKPRPHDSALTQHGASDRDYALRGMQRWEPPRWPAMDGDGKLDTNLDGVWEKGHERSLDELAPEIRPANCAWRSCIAYVSWRGLSRSAPTRLLLKKVRYQLHSSRPLASPASPTLVLCTVNAPAVR